MTMAGIELIPPASGGNMLSVDLYWLGPQSEASARNGQLRFALVGPDQKSGPY